MSKKREIIEYFIDGTMGFLKVGHMKKDISYPILLGDIVASLGKLENGGFSIEKFSHIVVLAHPNVFNFENSDKEIICNAVKTLLKDSWTIDEVKCIPYDVDTKAGSSFYSRAKNAIMEQMKTAENELLDDTLTETMSYDNVIFYKDGEFDRIRDVKYDPGRVISICKKMSIDSLERNLINGQGLLAEVTGLGDNKSTKLYSWSTKEKKHWWTWYLKLRNTEHKDKDHVMSDIIQCTIESQSKPSDEMKEEWEKRLEKLAYPTCYGLDRNRWRTHIYPIYLTELFCKNHSVNQQALEKIVYGDN